MMNCPFCNQDSAGNHEPDCPNRMLEKPAMSSFFDSLNLNTNIEIRPGPEQVLITQFIELLTAYMMTIDAIELAGDRFGEDQLLTVGRFIENALRRNIAEIVAIQETIEYGRETGE